MRELFQRLLERDVEDLLLRVERSRFGSALDVRAVRAVLCGDRLSKLDVFADKPRKREEFDAGFKVDRCWVHRREERGCSRLRILALNDLRLPLRQRVHRFVAGHNVSVDWLFNDVRAVTPNASGNHRGTVRAHPDGRRARFRCIAKLTGFLQREFVWGESVGNGDVPFLAVCSCAFEVRPELPAPDDNPIVKRERVRFARIDIGLPVDTRIDESGMFAFAEVPLGEVVLAREFAVGNAVEIVLEFSSEVVFDKVGVELLEQCDDGERDPAGDKGRSALSHVSTFEKNTDDGRIRRGASDSTLFERLDEAGFRVSRRRRREVAFRFNLRDGELIPNRQSRNL